MIQIARFTRQQARYLSRTAKKSMHAGLQHWLHPLLFAMCTGLSGVPAAHAQAGNVLPTGMTVINGQVNAVQNGKNLTLTTSDKSVLNWQSFSVGAQNGVVFQQPSASSQVLNRVVGQDPSSILGSLQSNGKIWLLNPNGVLFGKDARIDVGGLVASSLHLDTADFLASRYLLKTAAGGSGTVVNQGQITTPYGGQVMLVGTDVQNTGSITTPGGHTGLLAGSLVELTDTATPFMSVRVPVKAGQVLQSGSVSAERIDIHGAVVNQAGTLTATSMTQDATGQIVLRASGQVTLGGTLDASSNIGSGGSIDVRGDNVLVQGSAQLLANATGQGNGGRIVVLAENAATVKGQLSVRGGPQGGDGGFIETSGHRVDLEGARIDASAPLGKTGTWLIDPVDFTIAASGGSITGAALSSQLGNANVEIQSSSGSTGTAGDINVNDAVSWSANQLTLTAAHDININAVMAASGTSSLVLNAATANGADSTVPGGMVRTGFDGSGNFAGRVDFPGRSGTGFLTINGNGYTVLDGLGVKGDISGLTLQGMNGSLGGFYALGADIDASGTNTWNTGEGFVPIGQSSLFSGAFNGLGHTINALTINRPTMNYVGLFGIVGGSSKVQNIGLVNGNVSGSFYNGDLVGENYGTISNSYATGNVSGDYSTGGLVGSNSGSISNSYATGSVSGTGAGTATYLGGLVGFNTGAVANSYAAGNVSGATTNYVGGLMGANNGTISNSYATGNVTGDLYVGGLVGDSWDAISNSHYNIDQVVINGFAGKYVTLGGLYGTQYLDWLSHALTLDIANYSSSLPSGANSYTVVGVQGMKDLLGFADNPAYAFTLAGDTDLAATPNLHIPYLSGSFDGAGHTISNLNLNQPFSSNLGLFGYVRWGSVSNVGLLNATVIGDQNIGGLVGSNGFGVISNSHATGSVSGNSSIGGLIGSNSNNGTVDNSYAAVNTTGTGNDVGGLVGSSDGTVSNSHATGSVTGTGNDVGGLVGKSNGTVDNSYATGSVIGTGNYVGGLIGYSSDTVDNSYATGSVNGMGNYVGGLIGLINYSTVNNSYATGNVSGVSNIGGLVGTNSVGVISNSYATGNVSGGDNIGGLVGNNECGDCAPAVINNSYASGRVSGTGANIGGLVGINSYSTVSNSYWNMDANSVGMTGIGTDNHYQSQDAGAVGLTSAQMKQQASFVGWDFTNTWQIVEGVSYPSFAITNIWTGLGDNHNWSTVGNWSLGHVPTTAEKVSIPDVADTSSIDLFGNYTVKLVTSAEPFTLSGTGTSFLLSGGGAFNAGLTLGASTTLTSNGALSISTLPSIGVGAKINLDTAASLMMAGNAYSVVREVTALQGMNGDLSGHYALAGNIDASATSGWNSGNGFIPIGFNNYSFDGVFNGLGHMIDGLTINSPTAGNVGLFGQISTGSVITNVGLTNVNVSGAYSVGGLVGYNGGRVSNSYANGMVTESGSGDYGFGGLVGQNWGSVTNSYATGSVTGSFDVGGLIGYNAGTLTNSHYNIDLVNINGAKHVTEGGLYNAQYQEWFSHGFVLDIASYNTTLPMSGDHYQISSVQGMKDLLGFADQSSYKFQLADDIDLTSVPGLFIPKLAALEFDGASHVISNLNVSQPFNNYIGLIGHVAPGSTVKNIGVTGNLAGSYSVGGLVGWNEGVVSNGYANVAVTGDSGTGGLVGSNDGNVNYSYATGAVAGNSNIGGLVGYTSGNVSYSYATGSVSEVATGSYYFGGLVGGNAGSLSTSFATGAVTGSNSVGGLVGSNTGNVNDSYSTNAVSGNDSVGGLAGDNSGQVSNSYFAGSVQGTSSVDPFAGVNTGNVNSSYWYVPGQTSSTSATPLTQAELQQQTNFVGWDFVNTWENNDGIAAPTHIIYNTWTGLADNLNWASAGNWSLSHVPTAAERASIPDVVGTSAINLTGNQSARSVTAAESLSLSGADTSLRLNNDGIFNAGLTIGAGTSITAGGSFQFNGGTLSGSGVISGEGAFNIEDGTFNLNNGTTLTMDGVAVNWHGGTLAGSGALALTNGATFNIEGNGALVFDGPALTATVFNMDGGGTLDVLSGSLIIPGGVLASGAALTLTGGTVTNTAPLAVDGLLTLAGGTLAGTGALNVSDTLSKTGAYTLDLPMAVNNNGTVEVLGGTLNLAGGGTHTGSFFADSGTTLGFTGGTHNFGDGVWLSGPGAYAGGGTNVIQAGGWLGIDSDASIDLNALAFGGTGNINNLGALTGTGVTLGGALDNSGTVSLTNSTISGGFVNSGMFNIVGNLTAGGATSALAGGSINLTGGATLTKDGGTFEWSAGTFMGRGTLAYTNGANFAFAGNGDRVIDNPNLNFAFTNLSLPNGSLTLRDGGLTFNTSGVGGATTIPANVLLAMYGGTLTNNGALDVTGNMGLYGGTLAGAGAINMTGGTIDLPTASTVNWTASGPMTNSGTLNLAGRTITNSMTNTGTINAGDGLTFTQSFINQGSYSLAGGGANTFSGGFTQTAGSLQLGTSGSPANVSVGGSGLQINGGVLQGSGTVLGNLFINGGVLSVGYSPGALNVTGNLTLSPTSTTNIEIGGTVAGAGYDAISITGTANFGGALNFSQFAAFSPAPGDAFNYMTFAASSGSFSAVNFSAPANGWGLVQTASATGLTVAVPAPKPAPAPPPPPPVIATLPPALTDTSTAVDTVAVANTVLWQGFTLAEASDSMATVASSSTSENQANSTMGTAVRAAPTYTGASVSILDITPSTGLPGAELGAAVASNNLPSYRFMVSDLSNVYFRVLPVETMAMPELDKVLQSRRAYKKALFSNAIVMLEKNPELPDLAGCISVAQASSGACLANPEDAMFKTALGEKPKRVDRRVEMAAIPQIGRKVAVVVGINKYDDKRIPQLIGAVPDANAVSGLLRDQLGYDVVPLTNPNKADLFKALNSIAIGLKENDSLLIYYAGHGEMVDKTGMGYWIPGDANADDPEGWVSNADLNQLLARSKSKQMAVVSDSCYSGRFTAEGKVADGQVAQRIEDLLLRRAVTMMSSGGDEPVSDTGKEGHSVFAWNLMKKIREVSSWTSGADVFETVKTAVERELPQSPQYGASMAAGHEPGADFLFERRSLGEVRR